MQAKIIAGWQEKNRSLFGKQTIKLRHRLDESGLFSEDAIASLIDVMPDSHYNVNMMGHDHTRVQWREGTIAETNGTAVLNAVSKGRMWINLRRVMEVDSRYDRLLRSIFDEFEDLVPGLRTYRHNLGILVSSPRAQVYYHADIPGQALWQIAGRKRIYIYPNHAPFLIPRDMEAIVMGNQEEEIHYEAWFDDHAEVYDLGPGDMLHWALNGPHRVVNEDCLNISVTTEHWTNEIRNSYAVNYANGILRSCLGLKAPSRNISGPSVYAKAMLTLAWKKLHLRRNQKFVRHIDFKIDASEPNGIKDVATYAK